MVIAMLKDIQEKILYSDEITNLIQSKDIECVFFGGSSLEQLESPESDYNIILISSGNFNPTLNKRYFYLNHASLNINKPVQITLYFLESLFEVLNNPYSLFEYSHYEILKSLLLLSKEHLLYCSPKFLTFLIKLQNYREALITLATEGSLHSVKDALSKTLPIEYNKNIYYFYKAYYYWLNFKKSNRLFLTETQSKDLKLLKNSKTIPASFQKDLRQLYPYFFKAKRYDYNKLRKELVLIWGKRFL